MLIKRFKMFESEYQEYENVEIDYPYFTSLLKTREVFTKKETDDITKNLNSDTKPHFNLKPAMSFKRFFKGDDYDIDRIDLIIGGTKRILIWKIPDHYYLVWVEYKNRLLSATKYVKCDDIGGLRQLIKTGYPFDNIFWELGE
jgi:hypothetical protein